MIRILRHWTLLVVFVLAYQGLALAHPASAASPVATYAAYQPFERGAMLWRSDTGEVLVLVQPGWQALWFPEPVDLPDNPVADAPPPDMFKPVNAFGRVWGNHETVRYGLGWGTGPEVGYTAAFAPTSKTAGGLAQIRLNLPDGRTILLRGDETWGYDGPRPIDSLPAATTIPATLQAFEGGFMLFWQETGSLWVLQNGGQAQLYQSTAYGSWPENQFEDAAPPGFYKPHMGFGKVWGSDAAVRQALGWAIAPEQGYTMTFTRVTRFGSVQGSFVGFRVTLPGGQRVILYDNGSWSYTD